MPAVRKYPQDVMDSAVAMVMDIRRHDPERVGVIGAVGELMGVHPEVLRHWVKKEEARQAPPAASTVAPESQQRMTSLERENAELRKANAVLKAAAILFASELDQVSST